RRDLPSFPTRRSSDLIELRGVPYWFVDTAGIRRRVHQTRGADFYASLRTAAAIEKAEVGVVLVDASNPLTEQDIRVIQQVVDARSEEHTSELQSRENL